MLDGREGMTVSVPASYYLNNRGGIGSPAGGGSGSGAPAMGAPPGYKPQSNPNASFQSANVIASGDGVRSGFQIEHPSQGFPHGASEAVASPVTPGDPVKKKRGRPRKYAPDGANMSLGLSPLPTTPSSEALTSSGPKRNRGRPPGSGWKQQLAPLGEWMNSSAGLAFTPHVIHVAVGEDVAAKILSFAQQRPRALCILSASGSLSAVTIHVATRGTVTYEMLIYEAIAQGRFEIICLSGSYLLDEAGSPQDRTGGISTSVSSHDGHLIGGAVGGRLIAANAVQVIACSFVYGGKTKSKPEGSAKGMDSSSDQAEKSSTPVSAASGHDQARDSATGSWPPCVQPESRNSHSDIDLTRE